MKVLIYAYLSNRKIAFIFSIIKPICFTMAKPTSFTQIFKVFFALLYTYFLDPSDGYLNLSAPA